MRIARRFSGNGAFWLAGAATLALLAPVPAMAQAAPSTSLPVTQRAFGASGNADMDDLVARAFAVSEIARICRDQPCPVLQDCAQAKQLELDIDELLALLKEQQYQLELAVVQYQNHAITLTENEINDGERRAQLIDIAARQEFVIRLSDALAQIETVIGSVRSLRNFAQDGGSGKFAALDLAKLSAALVQLKATLDTTKSIATRPGTGLSQADLANFGGSVAGGLTKYDAARKGLDELTAAISAQLRSEGVSMALRNPTAAEALELSARRFRVEDSSLVDLGEILQGLLSNVAKQQLGERAKLIDDLRNDINAQASSRSAFIMSLHLLAARRAATEDAIAALEAAQRELQNCMAAARCSPATRERQAARLPEGIGSAPGRPGERPTLNSVLPTLLAEIDRLRPRIEPVVAISNCAPKDSFDVPLSEGLFLAHDSTTFCTFGDGKPTIALILPLPPQGPASVPPPVPPAPPPPPTGEGPCERTRALLDELERIRGDIAFDQTQSLPGDFADRRDALLKRKAEIEAELSGSPSECPVTPEALPPPSGESPCKRTAELMAELQRIRGNPYFNASDPLPPSVADERDALRKRAAEIEAELAASQSECPLSSEAPPQPSGGNPCERTAELMAELEEIRGNPYFNASDPIPPAVADERDALRQRAAEIEAELAKSQSECPSGQGEPPQAPPALPEDPNPRPPVREEYPVDPIPRMADPCEEARLIRERIEQISKIAERNATRGVPFEFEDQAAAGQLKQLQQRLADLARDCPVEREPLPPPSTPEPKPVTTAPPVTINVKATSRAVEEGSYAPKLANQVIRLFGPEDLDVALPTAQGSKPQDGHDRDPVQVVTNDAGEASTSIRVPLRFAIGQSRETDSGASLGPRVRLTFDATPQDSVNVIADKPEDLSRLLLRESLRDSLIGIDRIGNVTVGTLQFDKDKAEEIGALLRNDLPQVRVEPNLCRVKEPAAITEYHACKLGERRPPPGARILVPPGPHAELRGARISLDVFEQERGE